MSGISHSDGGTFASLGSQDIQATTNGEVHYSIENKSTEAGATVAYVLTEDTTDFSKQSQISRYNSGFVGARYYIPNSTLFREGGDGGLTIQAAHPDGIIRFVTGAFHDESALRITINNDGMDFNGHQATNFRVENRTSDPSSPTVGQVWLRTDL